MLSVKEIFVSKYNAAVQRLAEMEEFYPNGIFDANRVASAAMAAAETAILVAGAKKQDASLIANEAKNDGSLKTAVADADTQAEVLWNMVEMDEYGDMDLDPTFIRLVKAGSYKQAVRFLEKSVA